MLFALICTDKPNSSALRAEARPAHLAYLDSLAHKLKFAGPFVNEEGISIGTLAMVEALDRGDAEMIAANDPYQKVGLFASVEIKAWKWVIKNPELK